MKFSVASLLLVLFFIAGCSSESPSGEDSPSSKMTVGMVFDVGGRGDKSFNDAAYHGLELSRDSLGIDFVYIEPSGEGADREAALRNLAADADVKLIFGVGLLFSRDIVAIAREFPDKYFACIDYVGEDGEVLPPNLSGIVFDDRKGSFLAGSMAAMVTRTRTIGFIGGMESNVIRRFHDGYVAGAKSVDPDITIISGYIGMTGSAFTNPSKGKELALGQFSKGADIIYQAAGASGLGVVEAARQTGKLVIGTDRDQEYLAPGHVLSSMIKGIDRAVLRSVEQLVSDTFPGGSVTVYGLDGRYTDYVYNAENAALVGDSVHARLESIRSKLIDGSLSVD
ncbi:BMP family ABC transporter substrate-binding protein [Prosthecochloris sp. ZM]|uniref:BMP family lipoprotein n=1 Tax=Prosthecochloris sp. ZM TaxID=2283143 RepID=UPI000DF7888F|nr:BMP family ABC transporter substrate-binding protein [Prosthecochloris sp. ZM]RDD30416.1 BMP family ABC transporter substrate-binding protein [Prosthecochloris sp. ZM]